MTDIFYRRMWSQKSVECSHNMQSQKPSGLSDKGKLSLKDTHIRCVDFVFPESIYLKMLEVNFFLFQHENKCKQVFCSHVVAMCVCLGVSAFRWSLYFFFSFNKYLSVCYVLSTAPKAVNAAMYQIGGEISTMSATECRRGCQVEIRSMKKVAGSWDRVWLWKGGCLYTVVMEGHLRIMVEFQVWLWE